MSDSVAMSGYGQLLCRQVALFRCGHERVAANTLTHFYRHRPITRCRECHMARLYSFLGIPPHKRSSRLRRALRTRSQWRALRTDSQWRAVYRGLWQHYQKTCERIQRDRYEAWAVYEVIG